MITSIKVNNLSFAYGKHIVFKDLNFEIESPTVLSILGPNGIGKTTFIKEYATYLVRQGLKTAIIVNDYGTINVDRMLLGDTLSDSCHLEMVIGGDADCTRRRLKTKLITVDITCNVKFFLPRLCKYYSQRIKYSGTRSQ